MFESMNENYQGRLNGKPSKIYDIQTGMIESFPSLANDEWIFTNLYDEYYKVVEGSREKLIQTIEETKSAEMTKEATMAKAA